MMDKKARPVRFQRLMDAVSKSQQREEFTDFTLVCEGERFQVHKVIVCSQSAVLRAASMGPFKEASSGVYEMNEDSLPMVRKLIDYFYTADYDQNVESADTECAPPISALQIHVRMFVLADKYDIEGLRVLSSEKYSNRLMSPCSALEFLESVPDVYTLTAPSVRVLRDEVTHFARVNLENYIQDQSVREVYEKIATEVPHFVKDVLDSFITAPFIGTCFNCGPRTSMKVLQARCRKCGKGTQRIG
ncbi:hypothetical protein VTN77DRAFT_7276 [Rasamsonia byssochlamydoides]|uniref:uncharacterized protein n=1 Tax=Rasamsonia byssochlamydoides TaxID=89139 RepID=UPI0037429297